MACWVLPTVAAELWGVPIDDVWTRIGAGTVETRVEHGSLLVDVGPRFVAPEPAAPEHVEVQSFEPRAAAPDCLEGQIVERRTVEWQPVEARVEEPQVVEAAAAIVPSTPVLLSDAELLALHGSDSGVGAPVVQPKPRPRSVRRIRGSIARRATPVVPVIPEPVATEPVRAPVPVVVNEDVESEDGPPPLDEVDDGKPMNWREVRTRVGRTRKPPPRF